MRSTVVRPLVAVAALAAVTIGAAGADSRTDARLAREVRERLRSAPELSTVTVDVLVEDAEVLLAGRADRLADARVALRAAARVRGVLAVTSALEIATAGRPDHVVTSDVRAALRERPEVADGGEAIEVVVDEGRVTLRGEIARGKERLALRRAAESVPGVVEVIDETATPAVEDRVLEGRLFALLGPRGQALAGGRVEPAVVDGVVLLTGRVPRAYDRLVAEEVSLSLTGVRLVINELEVRPPPEEVPVVRP